MAVSYTHLDVYKRQCNNMAMTANLNGKNMLVFLKYTEFDCEGFIRTTSCLLIIYDVLIKHVVFI